jgi:hypothetical protein
MFCENVRSASGVYPGAATMNFAINDITSDLWRWIIFPILCYLGYLLLKWAANTIFTWDD